MPQNQAKRGMMATSHKSSRPGFFSSFAGTFGAPRTPEEAQAMFSGRNGDPWDGTGITLFGFNPGTAFMNAVDNMGNSVADAARGLGRETREAVRNIKAGQPIIPNLGKAASGYADFLRTNNPLVNAGATTGEQVQEGNYPGAAGSFAGGMAQGWLMRPRTASAPRPSKPAVTELEIHEVPPAPEPTPIQVQNPQGETVFNGNFSQRDRAAVRAQQMIDGNHPASKTHRVARAVFQPDQNMELDWRKIQDALHTMPPYVRARIGEPLFQTLYDIAGQGLAEQMNVKAERAYLKPGQMVQAVEPRFEGYGRFENPNSAETRWGWGKLDPYRDGIGQPYDLATADPDPQLVKKMTPEEWQNSLDASIRAWLYKNRFDLNNGIEVLPDRMQEWTRRKAPTQLTQGDLAELERFNQQNFPDNGIEVLPDKQPTASEPTKSDHLHMKLLADHMQTPGYEVLPDRMQVWGQNEPLTLEQLKQQQLKLKGGIDQWFNRLPRNQQLEIASVQPVEPSPVISPEQLQQAHADLLRQIAELERGWKPGDGVIDVIPGGLGSAAEEPAPQRGMMKRRKK